MTIPFNISLGISKAYLIVATALHTITFWVFVYYFEGQLSWLLNSFIVISLLYIIYQQSSYNTPRIRSILVAQDNNIWIKQSEKTVNVRLKKVVLSSPWLLIILWQQHNKKVIRQTIFKDMCSIAEFNQFKFWINWLQPSYEDKR